jgi:hypothetical protein
MNISITCDTPPTHTQSASSPFLDWLRRGLIATSIMLRALGNGERIIAVQSYPANAIRFWVRRGTKRRWGIKGDAGGHTMTRSSVGLRGSGVSPASGLFCSSLSEKVAKSATHFQSEGHIAARDSARKWPVHARYRTGCGDELGK